MNVVGKLVLTSVFGFIAFVLMLFLPAGTFHYWQAWVFIGVFAVYTLIPSVYLLRTNPAALERRTRAGPFAEARTLQRVSSSLAFSSLIAMIVFS
ncbi:MAG: isoprenylcysteine carboxylmethyltransferase family protein, partial [Acidimicrobiales bacterium]